MEGDENITTKIEWIPVILFEFFSVVQGKRKVAPGINKKQKLVFYKNKFSQTNINQTLNHQKN